jgi:hypothetical protein
MGSGLVAAVSAKDRPPLTSMPPIIRAIPANMIGELLSINTAVRLRAIPAQWEPLVTLGTPGKGSRCGIVESDGVCIIRMRRGRLLKPAEKGGGRDS